MTKRVALITGGTGGIGTAVCQELCGQDQLVVAGFLPSESEQAETWRGTMRSKGHAVEIVSGDVSNFDSSRSMVREVETKHGPIEILVNCAGITRDKTLRKMSPDDWQAVIDTNLNGVFNVTRNVVDGMIESGYGRVVNISSVNGQKGQFGQTNYSAAKAGVHGFTMALAQELANKGVTVNTISPGYVDTPMTDVIPEDIKNQIVGAIPIGDVADPSDIARAVGFFCQEQAAYITGANLPVNGGLYMS
ncbi:MAG: Acetoacetyl-CoA reductase [Gammaproteobacteria bacterium]|nr:Acetoacetyl-CoA reductase [Gammaproteobacteria bacterium]